MRVFGILLIVLFLVWFFFRGRLFLLAGRMFVKAEIDIAIQRFAYAPGDTISGTVALTLKKPVNARGVSISLIGEQTTSGGRGILEIMLSAGKSILDVMLSWAGEVVGQRREREHIYDYKQLLDGEKEYNQGREYRFEIKIPADIPGMEPHMPKGKRGQALKVAKTAATITGLIPLQETPEQEDKQSRGLKAAKKTAARMGLIMLQRTKWYLLATLHATHGLEIKKRVEVTIG